MPRPYSTKMRQTRRRSFRLIVHATWLFLFIPLLSLAHVVSYDDMWWNPAESGWGVNVVQQDDVLFLTWFIYGSDGKPTWITSDMRSANGTSFSGNVYSVTGSPYNASGFVVNPAQTVGTASIVFSDANHGTLAYSINGLHVTKAVTRLTFSAIDLSGTYNGIVAPGLFDTDATTFTVTAQANALSIDLDSFFDGRCIFDGTYRQLGSRFEATGTYKCSDFTNGTWKADDITVLDGRYFIGHLKKKPAGWTGDVLSSVLGAKSEGRESDRTKQDMWWNPAESGWGVNVVQQGNVLFLTWFIYGTDGRPTWVTSDLHLTSDGVFTGSVYRTSGSGYDAPSFAMQPATIVGSATLSFSDDNHATLQYSIDGNTTAKSLQRLTFTAIDLNGSYDLNGNHITVSTNGNTIRIVDGSSCIYDGTLVQYGKQFAASGTYQCSDFSAGSWTSDNLRLAEGTYLTSDILRADAGGTHQSSTLMGFNLKDTCSSLNASIGAC